MNRYIILAPENHNDRVVTVAHPIEVKYSKDEILTAMSRFYQEHRNNCCFAALVITGTSLTIRCCEMEEFVDDDIPWRRFSPPEILTVDQWFERFNG